MLPLISHFTMSPLIWDALQPLVNLEKLVTGTDVVLFETPNLGLTNMAFAGRSVLPLPCLISAAASG